MFPISSLEPVQALLVLSSWNLQGHICQDDGLWAQATFEPPSPPPRAALCCHLGGRAQPCEVPIELAVCYLRESYIEINEGPQELDPSRSPRLFFFFFNYLENRGIESCPIPHRSYLKILKAGSGLQFPLCLFGQKRLLLSMNETLCKWWRKWKVRSRKRERCLFLKSNQTTRNVRAWLSTDYKKM